MQHGLKIFISMLLLSIVVISSGCNTAAGFGKDLQQGGESIEKAANQPY